jgi:hypothetical protein
MKHLIILLIFAATLVAWSPNTNTYAVEKTEITEELAIKLGINIGNEVSYLEKKWINGKEEHVKVIIKEKRIYMTNYKENAKSIPLQPVFVTSEFENFKTAYYTFIPENLSETDNPILKNPRNYTCFFLNHNGSIIEFWYRNIDLKSSNFNSSIEVEPRPPISFSPNPASDMTQLSLICKSNATANLEFYDSNGNLVKQISVIKTIPHWNIINCEVGDLQVGMYTVAVIVSGELYATDKLIVMR